MKQFTLLILTTTLLIMLSACTKENLSPSNCRLGILGTYEEVKIGARDILQIQEGDGDKGIIIRWTPEVNSNPNTSTHVLNANLSENCNIIDIPSQNINGLPIKGILSTVDDRLQGTIEVGLGVFPNATIIALKR